MMEMGRMKSDFVWAGSSGDCEVYNDDVCRGPTKKQQHRGSRRKGNLTAGGCLT